MIRLSGIELQPIIDFLNSKQLTDKPCRLIYLPRYNTVYDPKNGENRGFAAYIWGANEMYVAGMPDVQFESEEDKEWALFTSITHEYIHHVQFCENREPDEDEAERWAEEFWNEFKGRCQNE